MPADLVSSDEKILRNQAKIEEHAEREKTIVSELLEKTGLADFSFED